MAVFLMAGKQSYMTVVKLISTLVNLQTSFGKDEHGCCVTKFSTDIFSRAFLHILLIMVNGKVS
jgi:hypothetical protein